MKQLTNILTICLIFAILHPVLWADELPSEDSLYFPPDQGVWETVRPEQVGWDGPLVTN